MEFIPFDKVSAKEWDDVVYHSGDGWAFSLAGWLEMVTPIWNMENLSFAIRENGKLAVVMPLHWIAAEKRLSSSGWGHGGPVIVAGVSATDRSRLWRACFSYVEKIAVQNCAERITLMISPLTESSLNSRWCVNPLVEVGFADVSTQTQIVNLLQTESELWFGLAKDARQKVKQARAAGYSVRRSSWKDMVDEYYRVHVENYQRTGVTPHPKAYFEGIAKRPSTHHVLWVGYDPNGLPVAFHNDARFGSKGLYHTGCSKTEHLKSGINYLLFWEAMLGAKADGCAWYETGEVFPLAKAGKEKGLTDFKSKFGGELHRFFRGEKTDYMKDIKLMKMQNSLNHLLKKEANYSIYNSEKVYCSESITIIPPRDTQKYNEKLLLYRLDLIEDYCNEGSVVLDLCCGTGDHLLRIAPLIKEGKGIDFSKPFILRASHKLEETHISNVEFIEGSARSLPFSDEYFDIVYAISALYQIPNIFEVIAEVSRVLKSEGKCLLDLGNLYSLNTFVCRATPGIAQNYHISMPKMMRYIKSAGLTIKIHRAFQILPMWGAYPRWLRPLLWNGWTRILAKEVKGKMLDEWISNLPLLKIFAFRHVFVCEKM